MISLVFFVLYHSRKAFTHIYWYANIKFKAGVLNMLKWTIYIF